MILALVAAPLLAGEITGVVTGPAGEAVAGATVLAYDPRLAWVQATTGPDGRYTVRGLPANPYRVRVLPPGDAAFVEQWAPSGLAVCAARVFDVGASTSRTVDVALGLGGTIAGELVDAAGAPVVGADVYARTTASVAVAATRTARSDPSGAFSVRGLAADDGAVGRYVVEVRAPGVPSQYVGRTYTRGAATVFEVAPGRTVTAGPVALLPGVRVDGTVRGPDGPLPTGVVHGYSPSQVIDGALVDGAFSLVGLPPGDVLVWAQSPGLATSWYPGADRPGQRIALTTEGASASADLALPVGSRLHGQVTGGSDPAEISVVAYNSDRTVAFGAALDGTGGFEVPHVHPGNYLLFVIGSDADLVSDFIRDAAGVERTFVAPASGDSERFVLAPAMAARVEGTVTDRYARTGVYGASVTAEHVETGRLEVATADADGRYVLRGLMAGDWVLTADYVHYCDADAGWVPVWYPDHVHPALGRKVTLAGGQVFGWDPALPPDDDHDEMDDVWERQVGLDPTVDDGALDPDDDGVVNVDEYRLGSDPLSDERRGCGCDSAGGGAAFAGLLPLLWTRRRRRR